MAFPTSVNSQITDAATSEGAASEGTASSDSTPEHGATRSNRAVIGNAPAVALSTLYQATAQSLNTAMQNAVSAQQNMNTLAVAVTAASVKLVQSGPDDQAVGLGDLLRVPYLPTVADEENN